MSKNIVVFSDGTGQEGGEGFNTNVYKLFNMVEDRTPRQIAFYDRGLGAGWRKLTGNAAGMGISNNILECYEFIFDNYEAGDQVFLFGFSRGAATVRSLASFIHLFGMLPKSRGELMKPAYKIYKKRNEDRRNEAAERFLAKHHTMKCKVRFLGVWDTVAALGVPFGRVDNVVNKIPFLKHRFHDFRLSEGVENACQALAIDDERRTFHPILWNPGISSGQTMKQVWFCGMHTDVGGGYQEQGLSDIALEWMVKMATAQGLRIYSRNKVKVDPDPDGEMHDSRGSKLTRFYRKKVRCWPASHGKPTIHDSVLKRTLNRHNEQTPSYASWILDLAHNVEPWEPQAPADGEDGGELRDAAHV